MAGWKFAELVVQGEDERPATCLQCFNITVEPDRRQLVDGNFERIVVKAEAEV
jgi:hypothetical protein